MSGKKRLAKELQNVEKASATEYTLSPVEDDLYKWQVVIKGPEGSCYEGGTFKVSVDIPQEYPYKAPTFKFATKIYHPSVTLEEGDICGEIFTDWKPSIQIVDVVNDILSMLKTPDSKSALEPDIAKLLESDPAKFKSTAQEYTKRYAT